MDIDELRKSIDGIDDEIQRLFVERMILSKKIGEEKRRLKLSVDVPERERAVVDRLAQKSGDYAPFVEALYREIFKISKDAQN